ncbi:hypothetical protein P3X46_008946 [Hevea brasiliensis]|uniref:RING-type E3 ubiquitin transferase n=1 Tax=Hevea brasiliensis TaxID=3981 RepID=A0ABQ9MKA5_HEVBR|nr:hypothetical protein P3X46_008946 [Hevea brasiliensis]
MDEEHNHGLKLNPILISLFGILSRAFIVATLHYIIASCHTQSRRSTDPLRPNRPQICNEEICSVCLCEFSYGEQIRVLLDCLHMFHVPCIDMWLISHSNCPLYRANAVSFPLNVVALLPDLGRNPLPEMQQLLDLGV